MRGVGIGGAASDSDRGIHGGLSDRSVAEDDNAAKRDRGATGSEARFRRTESDSIADDISFDDALRPRPTEAPFGYVGARVAQWATRAEQLAAEVCWCFCCCCYAPRPGGS